MDKMGRWITILLILFLLTGCWDRVEIEERGFVIGAGLEVPKYEEKREQEGIKGERPKGKQRYALTYQFVIPGAIGGGGGEKGKQGQGFLNVTSTGDSMFEITREMATRTSRSPFLEHLKVLLVSEELARSKGDFANAVDYFLRSQQTRRSTKVFIVEGSPKKALEFTPDVEQFTVNYIESIAKNHKRTYQMIKPFPLGRLEEKLLLKTSYAIPRLVANEKGLKVAGAAVFHARGNRMVGWLGEEETEGLNFLRNEIESGSVEGRVKDNLIVLDVRRSNRKLKVDDIDTDRIKFTIELDVEGEMAESLETMNYLEPGTIRKAEKVLQDEIKRLCEGTVYKLQDVFKVDVIGLGRYIENHHPKTWDKIGDDWDSGKNYFNKSSIDIKVNVNVRNPGVINESESSF